MKYEFTNWADETFTGRYGGINYTFAPSETRGFDPDKHYMLLLMAKQLADRELSKKVIKVGRDPKDMETWGKSLDEFGKPFTVTSDMRKALMRKAVGILVDTAIPIPDEVRPEAGATQETSQDVQAMKTQIAELTEMVKTLTKQTVHPITTEIKTPDPIATPTEPVTMTRGVLESMAHDLGIENTEGMTKEELIHAVSSRQEQI